MGGATGGLQMGNDGRTLLERLSDKKNRVTLAQLKNRETELKKASETPLADGGLKGVLGYTEELVVSNDIIHDSCSSIVDAQACMAMSGKFFKIISWYDNEWGYSNRLVDLALYAAKTDGL